MPRNPAFYFHSAAFLLQGKHKFGRFLCRFCKNSLSPSCSADLCDARTEGWFCLEVGVGLGLIQGETKGRNRGPMESHLVCHTVLTGQGAGSGRLSASPGHIHPSVQWFSKCGPWASNVCHPWELIKSALLGLPLWPSW